MGPIFTMAAYGISQNHYQVLYLTEIRVLHRAEGLLELVLYRAAGKILISPANV